MQATRTPAAHPLSQRGRRVMYLSGVIRPELIGCRSDLGVIVTPHMGNKVDLTQTKWGGDNGMFARPELFDEAEYLSWIESRRYTSATCLFITAPDVVGNAASTWTLTAPILPRIRALGFPASLVAQDGFDASAVDWSAFDVLFLGGSTEWKLSHHARDAVSEAKRHGKRTHMGRVNSLLRLRTAALWGCDTADGTFLAFGPDKNTPRLLKWLDALKREPVLNFGAPA